MSAARAEISLRHATPLDRDWLEELHVAAGRPADVPHLHLEPGDDYFCLVAEDAGQPIGYLVAGGSRDADKKSFGECYEVVVEPSARRRGVARALLSAALGTLEDAQYAGALAWCRVDDAPSAAMLIASGLQPDGSTRGREHRFTRLFVPGGR